LLRVGFATHFSIDLWWQRKLFLNEKKTNNRTDWVTRTVGLNVGKAWAFDKTLGMVDF